MSLLVANNDYSLQILLITRFLVKVQNLRVHGAIL